MNNPPFVINDPRPMQDELMYSYLSRLAVANFIPAVDLASVLIYGKDKVLVPENVSHISYGCTGFINRLAGLLGYDPLKFFLEQSIYPGIAPLLISTVQTTWINNVFRGNRVYPRLISEIKPEIRNLKVCPICMKTEISDHGFFWLHRKHHMPGVIACSNHGVGLISVPKISAEKWALNFDVSDSVKASEIDVRYAAFAGDFLDAHISANWWSVRDVLLQALSNGVNTPENEVFLGGTPMKVLRAVLKRNPRVDPEKILKALFILFGDVDHIPFCESDEIRNSFFAASSAYILESSYNETAVRMRKKDESDSFIVTPFGFIAGWRSPLEDTENEDEKYKVVVRNLTNGAYVPDGLFMGMDKKTFFVHADCGTRFEAVPSYLLEKITSCPCQKSGRLTETEVRLAIEKTGHFKLVRFTNTDEPMTVKCIDCGHSFDVRWKTWKKKEGCRICMREVAVKNLLTYSKWIGESSSGYDPRAVFEKRKYDLTGDEYVIIGDYKDIMAPVFMLHKKCGNLFKIIPTHFLHGGRCPFCGYPYDKEFLRYIEVRSLGRYTCIERSGMLYTIRDTSTGRTVTLRKLMIMQEFERPTLSEILPLKEKGEYVFRKTIIERVSDFISVRFGDGTWFTKDNIFISDLTDRQVYDSLKKLVRKGILEKKDSRYKLTRKEAVQ